MNLLSSDQFDQAFCLFVADHENDFEGKIPGELEKMVLVQHAVPPETGDGLECGAALDAKLLCLFQQPLVEQDVVVMPAFMHVKVEIGSFMPAPFQ